MKIKLFNEGNRNRLICIRDNGTIEKADLGPALPFHDLAHFVVEKELGLKNGFYGNINRGYSVNELSDKEIIRTLPVESIVSEIVTRGLQSLWSGAASIEQLGDLIEAEFNILSIQYSLCLTDETIFQMYSNYNELITLWKEKGEGEYLELSIDI